MRTVPTTLILCLLALGFTTSCGDKDDTGTPPEADADTDGDADSDSDGDMDADSDADGDSDADSDTDADGDTDPGIECDVDIDIDVDTDMDVDCDVDTDTDADSVAGIDVNTVSTVFYGEGGGHLLGTSLAGGGDINGDGQDDIVLGSTAMGAYVFHGPIDHDAELSDHDAYIATGLDALSFVGDLNADGFDDLLLGDEYWTPDGHYGRMDGAAYLFYGPVSGEITAADADALLVGSTSDHAGEVLDGGGDVDGDGLPDFLVSGVSFPGGDQYGVVYLRYDAPLGSVCLADSDARLIGGSQGDLAGYSAALAGDVDGDGHSDVIVGAVLDDGGEEDGGGAYLFLGPIYGDRFTAEADAAMFGERSATGATYDRDAAGSAVGAAGDHNGDGYGDVLVGADGDSEGQDHSGTTYLMFGPISGQSVLCHDAPARLVGEGALDSSGTSVGSVGDLDADGRTDIAIGAHSESSSGTAAGATYLFLSPIMGTISLGAADYKLVGGLWGENLGQALSYAGDVDNDGRDDLLVSGDGESSTVDRAGAAYLVWGASF